ncbi:MAG TPA: hypothetical protein VGQ71_13175, partial [Terriglobales bacterium]|nr:hypothetical protein [Terriglobales bacterium]
MPCPVVEMHHAHPDIELIEYPAALFTTTCTQARTDSRETDLYQRYCLADGSVHVRWLGLFEFLVSAAGDRIGWRSLNG